MFMTLFSGNHRPVPRSASTISFFYKDTENIYGIKVPGKDPTDRVPPMQLVSVTDLPLLGQDRQIHALFASLNTSETDLNSQVAGYIHVDKTKMMGFFSSLCIPSEFMALSPLLMPARQHQLTVSFLSFRLRPTDQLLQNQNKTNIYIHTHTFSLE